jgi:chromosome partitioning protein
MPVIVFASSKGGCGKTSLCVSVASELSRIGEDSGVSITIVDGDNHKHSATWAKREGCPSNVHYIESRREGKEDHDILDDISKAQEQSQFVLVDLQGSANFAMSLAVSQADYVIIPCQGSDNDALEALRTLKMIKAQEKILGRPINYAIAMTRIHPAVTPRSLKNVLD